MSFIATLKSLFGFKSPGLKPGDRTLVCGDCRGGFIFDAGEQRFFKEKGFTDPKRCPTCRKKVRGHVKKKFRRFRGKSRPHRGDSLIDGNSPYADHR